MDSTNASSPVTLDYANPRRRLNWKGVGIFSLIGFLIVTMCFNLVGLAFYVFWPIKYTSVEVMTGFGRALTPAQLAQHRSAITAPQFLAPIAARNGISMRELQSGPTVLQSGSLVTVSYTSRDPLIANAVASAVVMSYSNQGGLVALISTPKNPPMMQSSHPLQILSQTVAAGFGLILVIVLSRTGWGRRQIWTS
jgi:hypothetical protein